MKTKKIYHYRFVKFYAPAYLVNILGSTKLTVIRVYFHFQMQSYSEKYIHFWLKSIFWMYKLLFTPYPIKSFKIFIYDSKNML